MSSLSTLFAGSGAVLVPVPPGHRLPRQGPFQGVTEAGHGPGRHDDVAVQVVVQVEPQAHLVELVEDAVATGLPLARLGLGDRQQVMATRVGLLELGVVERERARPVRCPRQDLFDELRHDLTPGHWLLTAASRRDEVRDKGLPQQAERPTAPSRQHDPVRTLGLDNHDVVNGRGVVKTWSPLGSAHAHPPRKGADWLRGGTRSPQLGRRPVGLVHRQVYPQLTRREANSLRPLPPMEHAPMTPFTPTCKVSYYADPLTVPTPSSTPTVRDVLARQLKTWINYLDRIATIYNRSTRTLFRFGLDPALLTVQRELPIPHEWLTWEVESWIILLRIVAAAPILD